MKSTNGPHRFRPNVVLEGSGRPYAEEEWAEIDLSRGEEGTSAGSYGRMFLVSRCTRCMVRLLHLCANEKF